jgi:hypothetical protein
MRNSRTLVAILLILSALPTPSIAAGPDDDKLIRKKVLDIIVEHQHPKRFVIWDSEIRSNVIASQRVPRHSGNYQFIRSLKGVTPKLELQLIYNNLDVRFIDGSTYDHRLEPFLAPDDSGMFVGYIGSNELKRLEGTSTKSQTSDVPLIVGLSAVAYGVEKRVSRALIYAEHGLLRPGSSYGGEGFLFVRQNDEWKLEDHAYLWDGSSTPFWRWD